MDVMELQTLSRATTSARAIDEPAPAAVAVVDGAADSGGKVARERCVV
jgi:hypothetical protein